MSNKGKEPLKESQGYEKGRLMMEAYLARIKGNRNIKDSLTPLVDAKTNAITRYI